MDTQSLKARRYAGLSGLAFVLLFGVGSALWGVGSGWPSAGAPAAEIVEFYGETADRIIVGASLSLLGFGAFVLFAASIRELLAEAEGDDLLATTAFGGALLGLAAGIGAETINMVGALRARDGALSESLAQPLHEVSQILGSTAGGVGTAVFFLATAAVALRSGLVLPRGVAMLTGVLGIALLTPVSRVAEVTGGSMVVITLVMAAVFLRSPIEDRRS